MVDDALSNREMTRLVWCSPEKGVDYETPNTAKTIDEDASDHA